MQSIHGSSRKLYVSERAGNYSQVNGKNVTSSVTVNLKALNQQHSLKTREMESCQKNEEEQNGLHSPRNTTIQDLLSRNSWPYLTPREVSLVSEAKTNKK